MARGRKPAWGDSADSGSDGEGEKDQRGGKGKAAAECEHGERFHLKLSRTAARNRVAGPDRARALAGASNAAALATCHATAQRKRRHVRRSRSAGSVDPT